jgi:anti-sigma regulatory factor (Ser/Thr protein kinase)
MFTCEVSEMKTTQREWRIKRGDLAACTAARREFSRYIDAKTAGDTERYDASIIFGELVGNAVKCARSAVSVEVLEDRWTSLRVTDDGECFDKSSIEPQPLDAQSGRGLYIVNQLARTLDVAKGDDEQCEVTAELPIRS